MDDPAMPKPDNGSPADTPVERPTFVSDDVWRVVELASKLNGVSITDYVEKALLDEAIILEQEGLGRIWQVRTKDGRVGEVSFT